MSVNKVTLIGRVGKDPEVRNFDNGGKVANFTLATDDSYKKDGEKIEQTDWHNVSIWRGLAEVVEKYVKKGSLLYLEGKIKTRSYEKDGEKRYITEVICHDMKMLGSKSDNQQATTSEPVKQETMDEAGDLPEDDLPF